MGDDVPGTPNDDDRDDRFSVLEVFGLKLEVSNPRLAELLTMDAKQALTTDVRELGSAQDVRDLREVTAQALPDVVVSPPTMREEVEESERRRFRDRVAAIGRALGFDTEPDGMWESPTGVRVLTRCVDRPLSLAGASHFVGELADHRDANEGADSAVLFVVPTQQAADVFRVAIRQRRVYDVMRVVTLECLEQINSMAHAGTADHHKAVILLTPAANIDVGELLSVIQAAAHGDEGTMV
jgi:hypothetical protein